MWTGREKPSLWTGEERELLRKTLRNITIVAAAGCLLLILDLTVSRHAGSLDMIHRDGHIWLVRPAAGDDPGHVTLRARVRSGKVIVERDLQITLSPRREEGVENEEGEATGWEAGTPSEEERLSGELSALVSGLNDDRTKGTVRLPEKLSGGESVGWSLRRSSNAFGILGFTAATIILLYRKRFSTLEKARCREREDILRELPEFINQLVLLLGAGLVLTRAFERTVEEGMRFREAEESYFYRQMSAICDSVKNTNGSLAAEFRDFAKASGVGELMRIGNIIYDNLSKGSSLNEKLERESEALWGARRRRHEERGRLAETKMTLPLAIFLAVLIIITVSPALLQL